MDATRLIRSLLDRVDDLKRENSRLKKASAPPKFVMIAATSGTGKTFTADYLSVHCNFEHVDGDGPIFKAMDPEYRDMAIGYRKSMAYLMRGEEPPAELWQPLYAQLCREVLEAAEQ